MQKEMKGKIDVLWVDNDKKDNVVGLIREYFESKKGIKFNQKVLSPEELATNKFERSGKRFIKIQDGCSKFCHYCVIPFRRGLSKSRKTDEIVSEVVRAEKEGMKQVILTGVDIMDFKPSLTGLLKKVLGKTKKIKIGLGSINYAGFDKKFIDLWIKNKDRLVNYLHISLQSGSNQTLKRMNRRHGIEEYMSLVKLLRKKIQGIKIGTDIIVGYPGETKEEFEESLRNIKKLKFDKLHVFRYSSRPDTVAEKMEKKWGLVSEQVKKERARRVRWI